MKRLALGLVLTALTLSTVFSGCGLFGEKPEVQESSLETVTETETETVEEETEEIIIIPETEESELEETTEEAENTEDVDDNELVLIATGCEYLYQFESGDSSDAPSGYALLQIPVIVSDGYDKLEMSMQSLTSEQKRNVDAFMGEIRDAQAAGETGTKYSWEQNATIYRADHELFSVLYKVDTMYGMAAHPNTQYHAWNINPITGEILPVSMLVNDVSELTGAIISKVEAFYEDDYLFPEWRDKIESGLSDGSIAVALSEAGAEVVINTNAIAAYALGETILTLTYEEYPNLVRPEYFHEDFLKVQRLTSLDAVEKDLNGDGIAEYLNAVTYRSDEDENLKGLKVIYGTNNETAVTFDLGYHFDISDVYLVEPEEGLYYLLVNFADFHNAGGVAVLALSNPEMGAMQISEYAEGGFLGNVEKPDEFNMLEHVYSLGTYDSVRISRLEDGQIVSYNPCRIFAPEEASLYDPAYGLPSKSFRESRLLTLKKDLECQVFDYNEGILDTTVTLSAGTICYAYLTDNRTIVIIGTQDGGYYYLEVEDWKINGEMESEYFDNLMYAG